MDLTANYAWLVLLLGIVSTTQTHLDKALERQGIETWDLIRSRIQQKRWEGVEGASLGHQDAGRKPLLYTVGIVLNHTTFLYHLMVAPLGGTAALYTSMYGIGLIALLFYATWVMKEEITRLQVAAPGRPERGGRAAGATGKFARR